jgi:altered-inheritance-of-mitochondria protein 5
MLNQQHMLLNSIVDPEIIPIEDAPRFVVKRANWTEAWKDRWNSEVEGAIRWCQNVEWDTVRQGLEGRVQKWTGRDPKM